MPDFAEPLARLITEFKHLPGVGQKSAQRLAFHLMRSSREDAERLSQAILDVKDKLGLCPVCNNISEGELCQFCRDTTRDQTPFRVITLEPLHHEHHARLYIRAALDQIEHHDSVAGVRFLVEQGANRE